MLQEARQPFNLAEPPLLRVVLFRLAVTEHVLCLTTHHIANDGWSMGIFYHEFCELYQAFVRGMPSPLPPLQIEYSDYAAWQRWWLSGDTLNGQLEYWQKQLGGKLPMLNLPTDRPRPPIQSLQGAMHCFQLGRHLSTELAEFSRREGATLFMTLLAGFEALLHKYSGQDDILVGSPIAGRTRIECEQLIGLFVNTLVFRGYPAAETSFRKFLQNVRTSALEAYAHQDVPFEKLVEALHVERDLSRSPIFQAMFVLQNSPAEPLQIPGLTFDTWNLHTGTAKYDLTLVVEDHPDGLRGYLEYNTDLFEQQTIAAIPGHLETLLAAALDNPELPLGQLPLLTLAERERLLVQWNETQVEVTENLCVHQAIEAQVERTPGAVAVVVEERQLTYSELNSQANLLARLLQQMGVGPESIVGICVDRSLEMITAMLAILKAGGAYLPLDPAYPKDRLRFMVDDAHVTALVTQANYAGNFELPPSQLLCIDRLETSPVSPDEPNAGSGVTPENLAYVIYTSGSTGKPKGVMISHRNVINFFAGMDGVLGTSPGVWLAVTSISFDISVLELLWTLSRGFKVVIQAEQRSFRSAEPTPSVRQPRALLPDYSIPTQIERHQVTHFQCTPSLAAMLLQEPKAPEAIGRLQHFLLGGEALPAALVERLQLRGQIHNMYGPTETTVWSTSHVVLEKSGSIPIGCPIANTQIYILDQSRQAVPRGVPGEIYIGGLGVTRGYLNRPGLTAERFVPNPFSHVPGARLYRTGDLARYLPDGTIEFLGRIDHQVKVRGFRIELGEIEAAVRDHNDIGECVVVLREVGPNDKRVLAYVVPKPRAQPNPLDLRRFVQKQLPDYMVPSAFVFLDQLPLTPNGKVDRKALPEPESLRSASCAELVGPRTDREKTILVVWRELLQVETIGVHDNFFDLGGHSLLVLKAQALLSEKLGITLPVLTIFQYPTISALAKHLGETEPEIPRLPGIQDRARRQRAVFSRGADGKAMKP